MPRSNTAVKPKLHTRFAAVDLHCHGGHGVDLMAFPSFESLDKLTLKWGRSGVGAWVPTTLSTDWPNLLKTVDHLGAWIVGHRESRFRNLRPEAALPLGLHIEGPFLNPQAAGAHRPESLMPATLPLLEELWERSRSTLRIVTLAPEIHAPETLKQIGKWAKKREIRLSIGHSRATRAQCLKAFENNGFTQITHAFNAMPFHHRETGPVGAALGRRDTFIEVIPDGVHVAPEIPLWLSKIHPNGVCFVSDSTPAAETSPGTMHSFGPLKVKIENGGSRIQGSGSENLLAGGAQGLAMTYKSWIWTMTKNLSPRDRLRWIRATENAVHRNPLRALGLTTRMISKKPKISV